MDTENKVVDAPVEEPDYVAEFFDSNPAAEAAANAIGTTDNMLEDEFAHAEPKIREILTKNGIEDNIEFAIKAIKDTYIAAYENSLDSDDFSDAVSMITSELSHSLVFFFPDMPADNVADIVYQVRDALLNNDYVDLSNLTDEDDANIEKAADIAQDILNNNVESNDVESNEPDEGVLDDTDINDEDDVDPTFWD